MQGGTRNGLQCLSQVEEALLTPGQYSQDSALQRNHPLPNPIPTTTPQTSRRKGKAWSQGGEGGWKSTRRGRPHCSSTVGPDHIILPKGAKP